VVTKDVRALANHSYSDSRAYAEKHRGQLPKGEGSLERFTRASTLALTPKGDLPSQAFAILDDVRQGGSDPSQWNIVYEPGKRRVWFRTRAQPRLKHVDLSAFDPSCRASVEVLDIDDASDGDVRARFKPYDDAANEKLVKKSVAPIANQLPPGVVDKLVKYPSLLQCTLPATAAR
jgi:hypothetical protein